MTRDDLVDLVRPERRRIILSVVVAVVQGVLLYPTLWLVRELFDVVIPLGDVGWALLACAGILVARLASTEIGLLQRTIAMRAAKGAAAHRRRALLDWLLGADVASLENLDPGRIQSRLVHETERLDVMLNRALSVVVPSGVAAALALVAMAVLDWRLAILSVVLGVPAAWLAARGGGLATEATHVFQAAYEKYTSFARFAVRHLMLIRTRGHVDDERAAQHATIDELRDRGVTMAVSYARQGRRQAISATTVAVAVLALGSYLVIQGNLTVGGLAAFYVSAVVCGNAVTQLGGAIPDLRGGMIAADRIAELTGESAPSPTPGANVPGAVLPVRLHAVSFSYGDRRVLDGVDLELDAGEHIDLGGPNGAGKSTLVRVLLGLERPDAGDVTVAGASLATLDGEQVRRRIGYAPQKPTFFSGTVLENLLYGRPGATRDDAQRAIDLAGVAEVVARLEHGLDSPLGEDGVRLSGGEGQRLAIARALVGEPDLVVLDEPGNHLPRHSVAEIVERLRTARPELAVLTIGHGHLVPGIADRSLVLRGGRLEEVTIDG